MKRLLVAGGAGLVMAAAAAHPHLERSTPAADSKIAEVQVLRLAFSEAVEPRLSLVRLETAEERTVTEPAAEPDPADARVLVVHLYEKLAPGIYKVHWTAVGADGHKVSGSYSFMASR